MQNNCDDHSNDCGHRHHHREHRLSFVDFSAALSGANESPVVVTTAVGTFTATFDRREKSLAFALAFVGLSSDFIAAHLHHGDTGVSGPIEHVISGVVLTADHKSGVATGKWTGLTRKDLKALFSGDIYVDVHSVSHPLGELRGQVVKLL